MNASFHERCVHFIRLPLTTAPITWASDRWCDDRSHMSMVVFRCRLRAGLLLLQDYHEEHALQAFRKKDVERTGSITALDFYDIMTTLKSHLLTHFVKENLLTVSYERLVASAVT